MHRGFVKYGARSDVVAPHWPRAGFGRGAGWARRRGFSAAWSWGHDALIQSAGL